MHDHPRPGSARAFVEGHARTVAAVRGAVAAVAAGFSFPADEARQEAIQDALGRVVQAIRSGRYREEASLTTFAHGVAHLTCIEHARRHTMETIDEHVERLASPMVDPEEALLREEELGRNLSALSRLSTPARELLHLIFVEHLSYRDAGRRLGLSETAVKSRVHRYRLLLRDRGKI